MFLDRRSIPMLFRSIDPIVQWMAKQPRLRGYLDRPRLIDSDAPPPELAAARHAHRAVLIGFGPTGRTVARLLKESGIEPYRRRVEYRNGPRGQRSGL
jgi:CPA2 family monovalent cation:H+ antiporter-2